jgi:hypothetical protein
MGSRPTAGAELPCGVAAQRDVDLHIGVGGVKALPVPDGLHDVTDRSVVEVVEE